MKLGFAKIDITPRVGVDLCGFGPFLNRHSIGIRDRLWARAMAMDIDGLRAILITCDLIGISSSSTTAVRSMLDKAEGLAAADVMICCSHTHSGPAPGAYIGWGEVDPPWLETLPGRIVNAAQKALAQLQPAILFHAQSPCEGIGQNREYDKDALPLDEVLADDWRPAKPELTDTTCHVISARTPDGKLLGFMAYFGCHPVVCCQSTRYIHGDYPGIALNWLEKEHDGVTGLFLQGALGDVNSCVVHKPEQESMLALDIIAGRFARSVRNGIQAGTPIGIDVLKTSLHEIRFSRKHWSIDEIRRRLSECESIIHSAGGDHQDRPPDHLHEVRMNMVYVIALRRILQRAINGESLEPPTEIHGMRLGPLSILGSPFETFQAIRNEVCDKSSSEIPLVVSVVNDSTGYAPDETSATRGGYAADMVPLICGGLPYANIHRELLDALLALSQDMHS